MWHYRPDELTVLFGYGTPTAAVPEPTLYIDLTANKQYLNAGSGSTTWNIQSSSLTPYLVDGAISTTVSKAVLTKGSAGAYTLAAPPSDGITLIVTNGTAFAHVITATGLIQDGITGGAKNTMTFAAFVGSSIELISYSSKWNVVAKNVVTIA